MTRWVRPDGPGHEGILQPLNQPEVQKTEAQYLLNFHEFVLRLCHGAAGYVGRFLAPSLTTDSADHTELDQAHLTLCFHDRKAFQVDQSGG